jgi:chromate transport protein ChrA
MRYLLAGVAIALVVFVLWSAYSAFRSKIEHPWWWTFVCLVCAPVTTFNLTTGQAATRLLAFNLFGAGYWHVLPNGPTMIQVAFPAGALLFWTRRRALLARARPAMAEDQLPR